MYSALEDNTGKDTIYLSTMERIADSMDKTFTESKVTNGMLSVILREIKVINKAKEDSKQFYQNINNKLGTIIGILGTTQPTVKGVTAIDPDLIKVIESIKFEFRKQSDIFSNVVSVKDSYIHPGIYQQQGKYAAEESDKKLPEMILSKLEKIMSKELSRINDIDKDTLKNFEELQVYQAKLNDAVKILNLANKENATITRSGLDQLDQLVKTVVELSSIQKSITKTAKTDDKFDKLLKTKTLFTLDYRKYLSDQITSQNTYLEKTSKMYNKNFKLLSSENKTGLRDFLFRGLSTVVGAGPLYDVLKDLSGDFSTFYKKSIPLSEEQIEMLKEVKPDTQSVKTEDIISQVEQPIHPAESLGLNVDEILNDLVNKVNPTTTTENNVVIWKEIKNEIENGNDILTAIQRVMERSGDKEDFANIISQSVGDSIAGIDISNDDVVKEIRRLPNNINLLKEDKTEEDIVEVKKSMEEMFNKLAEEKRPIKLESTKSTDTEEMEDIFKKMEEEAVRGYKLNEDISKEQKVDSDLSYGEMLKMNEQMRLLNQSSIQTSDALDPLTDYFGGGEFAEEMANVAEGGKAGGAGGIKAAMLGAITGAITGPIKTAITPLLTSLTTLATGATAFIAPIISAVIVPAVIGILVTAAVAAVLLHFKSKNKDIVDKAQKQENIRAAETEQMRKEKLEKSIKSGTGKGVFDYKILTENIGQERKQKAQAQQDVESRGTIYNTLFYTKDDANIWKKRIAQDQKKIQDIMEAEVNIAGETGQAMEKIQEQEDFFIKYNEDLQTIREKQIEKLKQQGKSEKEISVADQIYAEQKDFVDSTLQQIRDQKAQQENINQQKNDMYVTQAKGFGIEEAIENQKQQNLQEQQINDQKMAINEAKKEKVPVENNQNNSALREVAKVIDKNTETIASLAGMKAQVGVTVNQNKRLSASDFTLPGGM